MAKQIINIGLSANDKSGDPLRTAFNKVNENFTELYATADAGLQLPAQVGHEGQFLRTDGASLSWVEILNSPSSELVNGVYAVSLGLDGTLTFPNNGTINNTSEVSTSTGTIHTFTVDGDGNTSDLIDSNQFWIVSNANSIEIQPGWIITFANGQQKTVATAGSYFSPPYTGQYHITWSGNLSLTGSNVWPLTVQSADYSTGVSITKLEITPEGTTTWTFDSNGIIKLPASGDIIDSNGVTVLGAPAVIDGGNASTTF